MSLIIEILIYSYMVLCVCIVIFNILFMIQSKTNAKLFERKRFKWIEIIENQFDVKGNSKKNEKHKNILKRRLCNLNNLLAYNEALQMLMEVNEECTKRYIKNNIEITLYLANRFLKKESIKKAYLSYMLSMYISISNYKFKRMGEILVNYTIDESVYCRENALRAIYEIGDEDIVLAAYKHMNRNNVFHNQKLVSDGLMLFKGNKDKLCSALWLAFDEFSVSYKIAFINFIKMQTDDFSYNLLMLLDDSQVDKEVKFAVIRYFRKHRYNPAKAYLINYLDDSTIKDKTYSALAAASLENYPCDETISALKSALRSSNWYTRYNAATSLSKLDLSKKDLADVYNGDDKFAIEMLNYKMLDDFDK